MKNEIGNLKIYLREARRKNWNDGCNPYILENNSTKAISIIEVLKSKFNDAEEIVFCDYIIKELEKTSTLLELYSRSNKRDVIIGNDQLFDKIRDNLIINLSRFLDYFDELAEY